jgi:hypothetical protein
MKTRDLAMTTAGVVAVTAWVAASVTAWLLVTAPATVAMAINGRDAQSLVQLGLHALYDLLVRLVRYL